MGQGVFQAVNNMDPFADSDKVLFRLQPSRDAGTPTSSPALHTPPPALHTPPPADPARRHTLYQPRELVAGACF